MRKAEEWALRPEGSIDTYWSRMKREAKLGAMPLHDLRHRYAGQAGRPSFSLPTIERLLGQARIDSIARYTRFTDNHLVDVAQQTNDPISAP